MSVNTTFAYEQDYMPAKPMISQQLVHIDLRDERVQEVLIRVREGISGAYPDAEFVSYIGTIPLGIYLEVYTAANDLDGILSVLSEQLGDLNVDAGANVCGIHTEQ